MVTLDVICLQNSKGIRMEQALTQLDVKIRFDNFSYPANIRNTLCSLKLGDN